MDVSEVFQFIAQWWTGIDWWQVARVIQLICLYYFVIMAAVFLLLNVISLVSIRRHMEGAEAKWLPRSFKPLMPPISILVPAYNEAATVVGSVKSLMRLDYPDVEIIVINDGSKDETMGRLISAFALEPFPEVYRVSLPTAEVRQVYRSRKHAQLRVIDKDNGGKADALNAGINLAKSPLVCCVDADSILQQDSLQRMIRPFLDDERTVAAGGTIRVANGCQVYEGFLADSRVPRSLLARLQVIEYLRAFLFGRTGWSAMNAVTIISGAFGLFRKSAVLDVGGYRTQTVGEDMELILRLQARRVNKRNKDRVVYIPDPICWTEVPEDIGSLRNQRIRWQRGLMESLTLHRRLLFRRHGGVLSWLALPFMWVIEALGPIVELTGYILTLVLWLTGNIDQSLAMAFLLAAIGLGVLISTMALVLEEISFRVYKRPSAVFQLLFVALMENIGYRQLNTWWRLRGLFQFARGKRHQWGAMRRSASWHGDVETAGNEQSDKQVKSTHAGQDKERSTL